MTYAVVIPAQESNKYHIDGDLAAFGDTTLLEWKISQCLEFFKPENVYICAESTIIRNIAEREGVNYLARDQGMTFNDAVVMSAASVCEDNLIWMHTTAPFLGKIEYSLMIDAYENMVGNDSLITVNKKHEYVYFKGNRLNFSDKFSDRETIDPIYIVTNGCYINSVEEVIKTKSLYGHEPYMYELDYLSSMEIKDIYTYEISKLMISLYFKKELHV